MKWGQPERIEIGGRQIEYRLVRSARAKKLRIRIGPQGFEVVQPAGRPRDEVCEFLRQSQQWIAEQLRRMERLRGLRRPLLRQGGKILFRGELTRVSVYTTEGKARGNRVEMLADEIAIHRGGSPRTPVERSLESWLQREARRHIERHLKVVAPRLGRTPGRIYVMGQRTKWGNCSARRNLSFNWRLIFAPDFVLRYLVTHEAVHLAVPDHSAKFWLTVQSLCPDAERARQWLSANGHKLTIQIDVPLTKPPVD